MIYFAGRNYENFYGGVEVLILNVVREFHKRKITFGMIGNEKYTLMSVLQKEGIPVNFVKYENLDNFLFEMDDLLICFQITKDLFKIKGSPKILVWNVLPYTFNIKKYGTIFSPLKFILNTLNRAWLKNMILKLDSRNAFYFYDKNCYDILNASYTLNIFPKYLPVPVPIDNYTQLKRKNLRDYYSVTVLGRADDIWKVQIIKRLYKDLAKLNKKVKLHIITNTNKYIENYFKEYLTTRVEVIYHFELKEQSLWHFLKENSDIHFAMGTSALEAAKFGIPTILLDYSKNEVPDSYLYQWIFESDGYCLGRDLDETCGKGAHSLKEIFDLIQNDSQADSISKACFNYVFEYHNVKKIVDTIIDLKSTGKLNNFLMPLYLKYLNDFKTNIKSNLRLLFLNK